MISISGTLIGILLIVIGNSGKIDTTKEINRDTVATSTKKQLNKVVKEVKKRLKKSK